VLVHGASAIVDRRDVIPEAVVAAGGQDGIVALYNERQRGRLAIKPGLTGPMQVYGRSDLTFEERLAMERDYLDNLSLLTDMAILLRTPRAIIRGDGAH
jgi:lipopolysaccharide/colanic/teichoic acid biosynthesis glycosyltransferase